MKFQIRRFSWMLLRATENVVAGHICPLFAHPCSKQSTVFINSEYHSYIKSQACAWDSFFCPIQRQLVTVAPMGFPQTSNTKYIYIMCMSSLYRALSKTTQSVQF